MQLKQLAALFIVGIGFNSVGGTIGALLPVFAGRLGADPAGVGLLFALIFAGMAAGNLFSGWISNRWQHRKAILIGAGILQTVTLFVTGQSANLTQLTILSVLVTVFGGMIISMANALTGLSAGEDERGRVFGILGSTAGIGLLLGGIVSGPVVDRWGYSGLFIAAALLTTLQPLAGLFLEDKTIDPMVGRAEIISTTQGSVWSRAFILLFLASIIAFAVNGMQGLSRTLIMDQRHFLAADITSTVAVGGLISIPFPFVIGWLSDRVGRKPLIIICYLATAICVLVLIISTSLWHFWVSAVLASMTGAGFGVGLAMVTDLVPPESIGTAIALFGSTSWVGLIIGSGLTGTAIENLGMTQALGGGGAVGFVSVVLLLLIHRLPSGVLKVRAVKSA